jgi:hypothetical protein
MRSEFELEIRHQLLRGVPHIPMLRIKEDNDSLLCACGNLPGMCLILACPRYTQGLLLSFSSSELSISEQSESE